MDMLFDSVTQSLGSSAYIPSITLTLELINNIAKFWDRQNILLKCRNQTSRGENHSWTNSQIRVWDTSFDLFLISLRHFPFPRSLDIDRALFRTHLLFIYSSEEFVHKPPDDILRISILTEDAAILSISVWSLELEHILLARLTNTLIKPILYLVELKESHRVYWPVKVGFL